MKRFGMVVALVALCTMTAGGAWAETNLDLRGIGLKAGLVNPEDLSSTIGFGLLADLGTFAPQWGLEGYLGYWQKSEDNFGFDFGIKDFSVGAKAKYLFKTSNAAVQPYAGGGLGIHFLNAHADFPAVPGFSPAGSASDTKVKIGIDLGGGVHYDKGKQFAFLGEAYYTIVSDASQFSLMVGAMYMFGR